MSEDLIEKVLYFFFSIPTPESGFEPETQWPCDPFHDHHGPRQQVLPDTGRPSHEADPEVPASHPGEVAPASGVRPWQPWDWSETKPLENFKPHTNVVFR